MAFHFLDNEDPGVLSGGGWTLFGGGYNSTIHYTPSGSGTNKATWVKSGLPSGATCNVSITWVAFSNRGTNVPWRIYDSDGTTLLYSGTLDQQVAPDADFVSGGVNFEILNAAVVISGTSITVEIDDNANGYVIADAVRIDDGAPVYTANTPGNWEDTATWVSGVVPSPGDVVTIEADPVVINSDVVVGASDADPDVMAVTITATGKLTVADGHSLTCKGSVLIEANVSDRGTLQIGETTGGATFTFDSSAATGTPNYYCKGVQYYGSNLVVRGNGANRSLIHSDTGGANGYFKDLVPDVQDAEFLDIGTDTLACLNMNGAESPTDATFKIHRTIFDSCGELTINGGYIQQDASIDLEDVIDWEPLNADWSFRTPGLNGGAPTGIRRMSGCTFHKAVLMAVRDFEVDDVMTFDNIQHNEGGTSGTAAHVRDSIFRLHRENSDNVCFSLLYERIAFLFVKSILNSRDGVFDSELSAVNPHWFAHGHGSVSNPLVLNDIIFDDFGSDGEGDCVRGSVANDYVVGTRVIGFSQTADDPGTLVSHGGVDTKSEWYHCTWHTSQAGCIAFGESGANFEDQLRMFKSNLMWRRTSGAGAVYKVGDWNTTTLTTDVVYGANADYNCGWNLDPGGAGGPGYEIPTTDPCGVHDIDEDPDFVNEDVSMATWVESIEPSWAGNATPTRNDYNARGLHKLRIRRFADHTDYDARYTLAAYFAHIRAGFTPQNPNILTAAHDGGTIGAVNVDVVTAKSFSDTLTIGLSEIFDVAVTLRVKDFTDTLTVSVAESFTVDSTGSTIAKSFSDTLIVSLNEFISASVLGDPLVDLFTGTVGTSIAAHESDSGHQWRIISTFNQLLLSGTGGIYSTHSGGASVIALSNRTPVSVNQYMEVKQTEPSHLNQGYALLLRATSPTNSHLDLTAYDAFRQEATLVIGKWVNGTYSVLTSSVTAPAFSDSDVTSFEVRGSGPVILDFKVNGITYLSYTDSSSPITVLGNPGIRYYSDEAGSPTTGYHVDSVLSGEIISQTFSDTLTVGISESYSVAVVGGTVSKTFSDTLTVGITDTYTVVHYVYKTFTDLITLSVTDTLNVGLATDLDYISVRAILGVGDITIQDVGRTSIQDAW